HPRHLALPPRDLGAGRRLRSHLRRQLGGLGPLAVRRRARVARAVRTRSAHLVPPLAAQPRARRATAGCALQAHARHGRQAPAPLRATPGKCRRRAVRGADAMRRDARAHLPPSGGTPRARRTESARREEAARLSAWARAPVPAISIVLATHDDAPWLDGAITTVRHQT